MSTLCVLLEYNAYAALLIKQMLYKHHFCYKCVHIPIRHQSNYLICVQLVRPQRQAIPILKFGALRTIENIIFSDDKVQ